MSRYEIEHTDGRWIVIDRMTGQAVGLPSHDRSTRLEAQALADFRNGIQKSTGERVQTRLHALRRAWRSVRGAVR
jgi:hypothetical protein